MTSRTATRKRKISVRMYNVGFGDAFLIRIPDGDQTRTILLDCGMHSAGGGPFGLSEIVGRIVEDVTQGPNRKLDIVIATHRHQDHVSGFANDVWDSVEVGEVWMPWTENSADPRANEIRDRQSRIARHLALGAPGLVGDRRRVVEALAANSYTNEKAMKTLHEGFGGSPRRRFLPVGSARPESFTTEHLPGVTVHVLGPSRDPDVIRDMDPEEGQSYLNAKELQRGNADISAFFTADWALQVSEYATNFPRLRLEKTERAKIGQAGQFDELSVAVALEKAVNGTSLFLALQVGKAVLLLPGDAQWGTWNAALENPECVALLRKTTFLKIGHHASHNGTPKCFVEKVLGEAFCGMASTRHLAIWKQIPKKELLQALRHKSSDVVRSDKQDVPDSKKWKRTKFYVETEIDL